MSKVIAIFNQKGGVGKTTTVINLATALSQIGKKVLICDIDPQANTTSGLGLDKNELNESIYDTLIGSQNPLKVIQKTDNPNLHILPSNINLAGAEVELVSMEDRENYLKKVINSINNIYNYIFIDCPPSLGLLSINALTASDSVIIPIQCEYYSLEGVSQLLKTVELIKKSSNPGLIIEGILLTMADSRTNMTTQVINNVRDYFKNLVFKTIIPRNIRLAEAPSFGKSVFDYDKNSKGAQSYLNLAQEFLEKQE